MKKEDVEYILHDFLEVRYGTNELENARIVHFLAGRTRRDGVIDLEPVSGFLMNGAVVLVHENDVKPARREVLVLNRRTREKFHYRQLEPAEKLVW